MARIRSIKPEQPKDEKLATLSIHARYLFAFLPTHADREGRLEDRPRVLKLEIFPWDDLEVEALLQELAPHFIIRYENDGRSYIQIRTFAKHQRPNNKELPSDIPAPTKEQMNEAFFQKKGRLIQKKRSLIQNEGIRECVGNGNGKGTDLAPKAQVSEPEPKILKLESAAQAALRKVVEAYKMAKEVDRDDKAWDANNFGRYAKSAAALLTCFGGDVQKAGAYIIFRGAAMNADGITWTLETITRHAYDGIGIQTEAQNDGQQHDKMGEDRGVGRGRGARIARAGDLVSDTLRGIEDAAIHREAPTDMAGDGETTIIDETEVF